MMVAMPEHLATPRALKRRQETQRRDKAALEALHLAIVADLDAGVTQAELVRLTGYTREHIRMVAKAVRGKAAGKS